MEFYQIAWQVKSDKEINWLDLSEMWQRSKVKCEGLALNFYCLCNNLSITLEFHQLVW